MSPNDEPVSFAPKPAAAETRKTRNAAEPPAGPDLISITLDAASGTIVGLERVDAGGARHEISDDDRSRLTMARATLEQVVEQAFEAGIDCVLGDRRGAPALTETDDEAELSGLLLRSLMERSGARRLTQGDVLGPAILGTLFARMANSEAVTPESTAAH
jgi:hypothetical protein